MEEQQRMIPVQVRSAKPHTAEAAPAPEEDAEQWRERALRLQAEMENFRRRQRRWAQEQIDTERERLLTAFLRAVDDLERALAAPFENLEALRQGVELTRRAIWQLLQNEGVAPVEAASQAFDPEWHEAVATVSRAGTGTEAHTVIDVIEPGYRLGDRLLRPAKVIVAV
jgi:molecular chaperone GrpE